MVNIMKKKVIMTALVLVVLGVVSMFAFVDYSPGGWTSSWGKNSMPGFAVEVIPVSNGYLVTCDGNDGLCYDIDGGWLTVNEGSISLDMPTFGSLNW